MERKGSPIVGVSKIDIKKDLNWCQFEKFKISKFKKSNIKPTDFYSLTMRISLNIY